MLPPDNRAAIYLSTCIAVCLGSQSGALALSSYVGVPIPSDAVLTGASSHVLNPPPVPSAATLDRVRSPQQYRGMVSQTAMPPASKPRSTNCFSPEIGTFIACPSSEAVPGNRTNSPSSKSVIKHQFDSTTGSYRASGSGTPGGLSRAEQLQRELRAYELSLQSRDRKPPAASPGITIANPSGYGADQGQIFAGFGYQRRVRYTGTSSNPFSGVDDGGLGFGIGLGNSVRNVGVQLSYGMASFGGSRPFGSGGFGAKVHRQFGPGWSAAIGGEGILNIGQLPEGSPVTYNDFENTYYGAVTHIARLRQDIRAPFSRIALTAGVGTGRFRSIEYFTRKQQFGENPFGVGAFGSVALRATPNLSLIGEWTGQDLAAGVSWVPIRSLP